MGVSSSSPPDRGEAGGDPEQQADRHRKLGDGQEDAKESPVRQDHFAVERCEGCDLGL